MMHPGGWAITALHQGQMLSLQQGRAPRLSQTQRGYSKHEGFNNKRWPMPGGRLMAEAAAVAGATCGLGLLKLEFLIDVIAAAAM